MHGTGIKFESKSTGIRRLLTMDIDPVQGPKNWTEWLVENGHVVESERQLHTP